MKQDSVQRLPVPKPCNITDGSGYLRTTPFMNLREMGNSGEKNEKLWEGHKGNTEPSLLETLSYETELHSDRAHIQCNSRVPRVLAWES